jgi:hypothetical protein
MQWPGPEVDAAAGTRPEVDTRVLGRMAHGDGRRGGDGARDWEAADLGSGDLR